jgi:hypothetical protein
VNSLIGSQTLLAQLDLLKSTVRDFAAREEQLNSTFRDESAREKDLFDSRDQQQITAATERLAAEAEAFEAARNQLQARLAQRERWIVRALGRVREKVLAEINRQDDECKAEAHRNQVKAEQQRDAELAELAADLEAFQIRQDEASADFQRREKSIRSAFGGYGKFHGLLKVASAQPDFPGGRNETLAEFQRVSAKLTEDLKRFKKMPLPLLFRFAPLWLWSLFLLGIVATQQGLQHFGNHTLTPTHAIVALAGLAGVVAAYLLGRRSATPLAMALAKDFARARQLMSALGEKMTAQHQAEQERIEAEFQQTKKAVNQTWKQATKDILHRRDHYQTELENRVFQLQQKSQQLHQVKLQRKQNIHNEVTARLQREKDTEARQLTEAHQAQQARLDSDFKSGWQTLAAEWQSRVLPLCATIQATSATAEKYFPSWQATGWNDWKPPASFLNAVQFGQLEVDLEKFLSGLPKDQRLMLPCPPALSLPLLLTHPQQGSLVLETGQTGADEAVNTINNIILRLLATTPPGRLEFTIFDPVGLGQNFAALMHLADYAASTINSRIWTQTAQFEEKLAELNEHMEKIIQMYLRNEYTTITEYNAEAGSIAEKYHFLVIASFPVNFSETAAKRLRNIAANGARCGVFLLVQWDQRNALPPDFVPDELRNHSVCLARSKNSFEISNWHPAGTNIVLDTLPPAEFTTQLLHRIGNAGKNANRVEVPFEQIAPAEEDIWTDETSEELRVPIGRSGATKLQYLAIGRDTRQHALIAGKTGSGKSTLFHIIITNLALRCSPEQVEFYLVDFKKGVEFKCYGNHHLPHARVVAIESDRAFGLSVLQRVDEELRRRGDMFRKVGAQDLAGYKRNGGKEPVPRTLLMIDEFQEFFVEEDRVSQSAAVLLDRIVRQGRAFGIHVLLGSQTLGGAYTLARATIGQMVIRIALQCNEADAYLIMDQDNPAPRLLSRPGEGIYNDTAGSIEGNSPFQAVWLPDRVREEYLEQIRAQADKSGHNYPGPIVFEGNAPADVRENHLLNSVLGGQPAALPVRIWLGAPNSIKSPTEAVFRRQSATNLLIVGQSDERGLTLLSLALVALAAQLPPDEAQFFVLHNLPAGLPQFDYFEKVIGAVPQKVTVASNGNLAEVMRTLLAELKRRQEKEAVAAKIFVLIHDLQNFKKLRQEDEFSFSASPAEASPAIILLQLINEGPAHDIHVILTCDSYGNVARFIGRKTLGEIEMRVAFQMSAADSASLIDAPEAATLGLHRAVLFNDRESSLETFRPYALPGNDWVETVTKQLEQLKTAGAEAKSGV